MIAENKFQQFNQIMCDRHNKKIIGLVIDNQNTEEKLFCITCAQQKLNSQQIIDLEDFEKLISQQINYLASIQQKWAQLNKQFQQFLQNQIFRITINFKDKQELLNIINAYDLKKNKDFEVFIVEIKKLVIELQINIENHNQQPQIKQEKPLLNQIQQQYQPQIYQQGPQINQGYQQEQPQILQGQEQPSINFGQQPQINYGYGQQPQINYGQQPYINYGQQPQTSYGQQPQISYGYDNVNYGYPYEVPQAQYEQPLKTNSQSSVVVAQSKQKKTETTFYKKPIAQQVDQRAADFQQLQNEKGDRIFDQNEIQQKYQFHFN